MKYVYVCVYIYIGREVEKEKWNKFMLLFWYEYMDENDIKLFLIHHYSNNYDSTSVIKAKTIKLQTFITWYKLCPLTIELGLNGLCIFCIGHQGI